MADKDDLKIDTNGDVIVRLPHGINFIPMEITIQGLDAQLRAGQLKSSCTHEWIEYFGFNDSFEYCKHCDIKRS